MEKLRISLLAVIFGSVVLVLGKNILSSTASTSTATDSVGSFVFPTVVPLPNWQASSSRPLQALSRPRTEADEKKSIYIGGRQYQYIQNNLLLDIQMRYEVNTGGGFNRSFLKNSSPMPLPSRQFSTILRHQEGIGFYNLFTYQQRAYLNACINSRGGSTVTKSQFMQNRYVYDLRLDRLIPWFLGQQSFKDKRCLWAHLSIPLESSSSQNAYRVLETAWFSWYQWWYPRFPKS